MNNAKIKKRIVYSVLFMRDDSDVLRFRMSSFWLKFFVYFIILIIAVAAGASFLSYHYWNKTVTLESRLNAQEAKLKPLQEQMGRLDRLSSFARAMDSQPSGELRPILQELGGSNATLKSQPEGELTNGGTVNGGNSDKASNSTDAVFNLNEGNATGNAAVNNMTGNAAGNATGTALLPEQKAGNPPETGVNAATGADIPVANDDVKITNFTARFVGRNKVKINFDLNNIGTQRSISGQVRITVLDSSQQRIALKPDRDNAGFRISFSKEFVLTYSLPEDMGAANVRGFLLEVEDSSGAVVHSERFDAKLQP